MLDDGVVSFAQVRIWLEGLSTQVDKRNAHDLVAKLINIVPKHWPSNETLSLSELDRFDRVLTYRRHWAALASGIEVANCLSNAST